MILGLMGSQVRFNRSIGAVPRAEMMDVMVEKLLKARHFYESPPSFHQ